MSSGERPMDTARPLLSFSGRSGAWPGLDGDVWTGVFAIKRSENQPENNKSLLARFCAFAR